MVGATSREKNPHTSNRKVWKCRVRSVVGPAQPTTAFTLPSFFVENKKSNIQERERDRKTEGVMSENSYSILGKLGKITRYISGV